MSANILSAAIIWTAVEVGFVYCVWRFAYQYKARRQAYETKEKRI